MDILSGPVRAKDGRTLLSSRLQAIPYKKLSSVFTGRDLPYFFLDADGHGTLAATTECVQPLIGEVEARLESFDYWGDKDIDPEATVLLMATISTGRSFWPDNFADIFGPVLHERETALFMRRMKVIFLGLEHRLAPFFGGAVSFVDLYASFAGSLPVVKLLVMPIDQKGDLEFEKYLTNKKKTEFFRLCEKTFSDLVSPLKGLSGQKNGN